MVRFGDVGRRRHRARGELVVSCRSTGQSEASHRDRLGIAHVRVAKCTDAAIQLNILAIHDATQCCPSGIQDGIHVAIINFVTSGNACDRKFFRCDVRSSCRLNKRVVANTAAADGNPCHGYGLSQANVLVRKCACCTSGVGRDIVADDNSLQTYTGSMQCRGCATIVHLVVRGDASYRQVCRCDRQRDGG